MSLATQVYKLNQTQVKHAVHTMLDASLVKETGGNWREIFRRAKHQYPFGRLHRIYALLENATETEIETMSASLAEINENE